MFKRNTILLVVSLAMSIVYFMVYTLINKFLINEIIINLATLMLSILMLIGYFRIGATFSKIKIKNNTLINNVLSISSLIVVSSIIWIYSFTHPSFNSAVPRQEWILYYSINFPFIILFFVMNRFSPYLYYIYPYITTFFVYLGVKYGERIMLKE